MAANSQFAVATHILTALTHISRLGTGDSRGDRGRVSSETIADSVNTNPVVVRRIVSELAKAGLIRSHQGKRGGLELSRDPEKITLYDVYQAMGCPPVFAFNPNEPNPDCPVSSRMVDVLTPVFSYVQEGIQDRLESITLQDLVHEIEEPTAVR